MREVQASDAKTRLLSLLDEVERGETVIVTRHGKPIVRIVPEADLRRAKVDRVVAEIDVFRQSIPRLTSEDLLSARHDGHRF